MGDEGPDSTPPSSCGSPRPILPFHLTSAYSDKRVSGGFAAGIALGRGGHCVCSISSPAPDLTSPFPASAMEEEEGALTRSHCVPSPVTRGLCWGTGQAPCAGSPVRRCGQRAGTPHQDRQRRQGQAWGLEGGGLKGYSGIVPVVTVPWGLPVPAGQGRAVGEEQVSQSSPWSHGVAALLPIKEKSLRQQILLSVTTPPTRAGSCAQTRTEQQGSRKSCP